MDHEFNYGWTNAGRGMHNVVASCKAPGCGYWIGVGPLPPDQARQEVERLWGVHRAAGDRVAAALVGEPTDGMKICPFCAEPIRAAAIKCRYCQSDLPDAAREAESQSEVQPSGPFEVPGSDRQAKPPAKLQSSGPTSPLPFLPGENSDPEKVKLELLCTEIVPVKDRLSFFVVCGRATNLGDARQSFHITVHGRTHAFGTAWKVGLVGKAETPLLRPGQSSEWQARIAIANLNSPTLLRYEVVPQERPGEHSGTTLAALDAPEWLGDRAPIVLDKIAEGIIASDSEVAPEEAPTDAPMRQLPFSGEGMAQGGAPIAAFAFGQELQWPHLKTALPLTKWRGMGRMTRKPKVPAYCRKCKNDWMLDSEVPNTLAVEQGLAGRLQRGGTTMERFGATFTPFASGRRIAAGNEEAQQRQHLANLYMLAACPKCGSTDVLLAR